MNPKNPDPAVSFSNPYPPGFIYGQGEANPHSWSLAGLKMARCLKALQGLQGAVLELGCGGGQYLRGLRRHRPDLKLYAIDLDEQAVALCQTIPGITSRQADAAALPFVDQSFSAVIGFDILEHVSDPRRVLAEAFRVLKPGGLFHCYVPCEGNPDSIYVRRGHRLKACWGGHVQQFTTAQVLEMVQSTGLKIQSLRHADYWLTQHLDYAFFKTLETSTCPAALWAAQSLQKGGGAKGWALRWARRGLSVLSWLEGRWRNSAQGAMGVHLTAYKKEA